MVKFISKITYHCSAPLLITVIIMAVSDTAWAVRPQLNDHHPKEFVSGMVDECYYAWCRTTDLNGAGGDYLDDLLENNPNASWSIVGDTYVVSSTAPNDDLEAPDNDGDGEPDPAPPTVECGKDFYPCP